MAFDFPAGPTDGQEFAPPGGPTYVYQTPYWMLKAAPLGGTIIADAAPIGAYDQGQLWWESDTGTLFINYEDANSTQWVQAAGAAGGSTTVAWVDVTGKPATYPPDLHEHDRILSTDPTAESWLGFKNKYGGNYLILNNKADGTGHDGVLFNPDGAINVLSQNYYAALSLDSAVGAFASYIEGRKANKARWQVILGSTAPETGANSGSDFSINRYDDNIVTWPTGDPVLTISRATGIARFEGGLALGYNSINNFSNDIILDNGANLTLQGGGATPGFLTVVGGAMTIGQFNSSGTNNGFKRDANINRTSVAASASAYHYAFYNTNGLVGQITTNASATVYGTTSDEALKEFIGQYDPQAAIDIIRADPVREWTFKKDGTYGVGWGAQTSHAINPLLASPPPEPQEGEVRGVDPLGADYAPWMMDYGQRTPYLWAALSAALDKIDALEARLAALEGA